MNLRLRLSGTAQRKRISTLLESSSRSSTSHSALVNSSPELLLRELPGDGVHAVLDERLAEGLRVGLEPPAQQLDLLLDRGVGAHWMISASQVFFTRSIRLRISGVSSTVSSAPGIIRATFCTAPSMTIECGSKSCGSSW